MCGERAREEADGEAAQSTGLEVARGKLSKGGRSVPKACGTGGRGRGGAWDRSRRKGAPS